MTPRWTFVDFVLVVLGGLLGTLVFGLAAGLASGTTDEITSIVTILGQYVGHLGVLWLIGRGRSLGLASLGLEIAPTDVLYVGLGVILQIALLVVFRPLQELLLPDGETAQDVVEIIQSLSSPAARVTAVAVTGFVAPLTEEIIFRGVLLRSMIHRPARRVMVVTSLVFALFHLIGVTSVNAGIIVFAQIFLVGLVLSHLTLSRGRLGPAIFLHAGFNLLAAIVLLLPEEMLEQISAM